MRDTDDWWARAACRSVDPTIFDPPEGKGYYVGKRYARLYWGEARALCEACPVRTECLRDALDSEEPFGGHEPFRAGYTPQELSELRKRQRRQRA